MKNGLRIAFLVLIVSGCATQKTTENAIENTVSLDTISISASYKTPYQPTETHFLDLLHTKLEVSFNWEKQYLNGRAELLFIPWFYPTNKLILDAKGFDIHVIALQNKEGVKELEYDYDGLEIAIELDKEYTRKDTFKLYIEYTAKPNELKHGGSEAITSDKGLYFIDPLNEDPEKPSQIWTQGETESSSCWFPTIDIPSEKMTQEISITVRDKYLTLSNGELIYQTENGDGTRTDVWAMKKPHAPYLAMMAIGEFSVIEDSWRDSIAVNYYVEKEYKPYAMEIFGKTPEMLECFSTVLGVNYPWVKYHQIVVRDYVSGAMENTSAVIHGGFVQQTAREMIDEDSEDIISHELFHHWFGDLVTCESWSNLPLNESFATYGEYIWREHKYNRETADYHLQEMLKDYIYESESSQEDMIRYYFDDKEEMFDSHSYAKGGRILHMLRKEVGEDAFYASLQHYLIKHAYQTVEIHDLRIAFEEITGRDLNWFFNQWFLSSGHPDLLITYKYVDSTKTQKIVVEQKQTREETPVYRLSLQVDLYVSGKIQRESILITERYNEFSFTVSQQPDLVNVDAEKMLLCVKNDKKSIREWAFQYQNAPLYFDRYEAIETLGKVARKDSLAAATVLSALDDSFWRIRELAINNIETLIPSHESQIKTKLITIASSDKNTSVRAKAIGLLVDEFKGEDLKELFINGTKDSSYYVLEESLIALTELDNSLGLEHCKQFENEKHDGVLETICYIYSSYGDDSHNAFFVSSAGQIKGYTRISYINDYEYYLAGERSLEVVNQGVDIIKGIGIDGGNKYVSMFAKQALENIENEYKKRQHDLNKKLSKSSETASELEIQNMRKEQEQLKQTISNISKAYDEVVNSLK
ncbi:MAG: M1 family metallopeptidase [Flavobacteriales bacterium]|nr:M1 family metallopeptidase [Flavobacteriales bacterium]